MTDFMYMFVWNNDIYMGLPVPDEKAELIVHAPKGIDVTIGENILENGRAVVPVILHNKEGKAARHEIKFEFAMKTILPISKA